MDPNTNLQESLDLSQKIINNFNKDGSAAVAWSDAIRLAELLQALDGWLSDGGFLPNRWTHGR